MKRRRPTEGQAQFDFRIPSALSTIGVGLSGHRCGPDSSLLANTGGTAGDGNRDGPAGTAQRPVDDLTKPGAPAERVEAPRSTMSSADRDWCPFCKQSPCRIVPTAQDLKWLLDNETDERLKVVWRRRLEGVRG
jgi:hypothetical protein